MYTYGEIFNCENCPKKIVRGSSEDNMTGICDECLSKITDCARCRGPKEDKIEEYCVNCGHLVYG